MQRKLLFVALLFLTLHTYAQSIESEINLLAGEFSGNWTAFRMNSDGDVVKSIGWKDTLRTSDPIINDSIAYVTINSVMHFDRPKMPPYKMDFSEGFYIEEGEIKSHFFTMQGKESKEEKVGNNTYVIAQPISNFELQQLGFSNAISASNTTIKVIVLVDGVETHKITRLSTIVREKNGIEETFQFISLVGYHQRIK